MIRLAAPTFTQEDTEAVARVLASGFLVQGEEVAAFERDLADYIGVRHAVMVSSGTAALHLALLALRVGPGDLVAMPAFSFVATANVVELCGAEPLFVDISAETGNMDQTRLVDSLERASRERPEERSRAVMPVHGFGQVAQMPEILETAGRRGVPVIEDAACALGATLEGKQAGRWGTAACFSFHPRKVVTSGGEGGAVVTGSDELAGLVRSLRTHGADVDGGVPAYVRPGLNYRMTEIQATLGRRQLARLPDALAKRRTIAKRYDALLADSPLRLPTDGSIGDPNYQSYVVLLPSELAAERDRLIAELGAGGIETNIGAWHLPLSPYYRSRYGYRPGDFPVTDDVAARTLAIPLHEHLSEAEQNRLCESLIRALSTRISLGS